MSLRNVSEDSSLILATDATADIVSLLSLEKSDVALVAATDRLNYFAALCDISLNLRPMAALFRQ